VSKLKRGRTNKTAKENGKWWQARDYHQIEAAQKHRQHNTPKTQSTAITNMRQMQIVTLADLDVADDLTGLVFDELNANLETKAVRRGVDTLAGD
jgi:hypothetical protein